MGGIDSEALLHASKALSVLFIITISLSSICLVIKLIRQQNTFYSVRKLMVIVLTLGSLLYALFTLVVNARAYFEYKHRHSCSTVLATVYGSIFFPFVYAVGLLSLAFELYVGRSNVAQPPPTLGARFFYIALPWVLGLVIVLPLTMAGMEWEDRCRTRFTLARYKAFYWVSSLLPSIFVLAAAIILIVIVFRSNTSRSDFTQRVTPSGPHAHHVTYNTVPQGGVAIASASRPASVHFKPHEYQSSSPPYQHHPHQHQQYHHHYQHQYQPSALPIQNHQQQHHQQFYPPPNYAPPPPGFGPPCYEYNPPHHQIRPPSPPPPPLPPPMSPPIPPNAPSATFRIRDLRNETVTLVKASVVFFLFTFPYGVYNLGYALNDYAGDMDELTSVILWHTIHWLSAFRWLVMCLCWFLCLK